MIEALQAEGGYLCNEDDRRLELATKANVGRVTCNMPHAMGNASVTALHRQGDSDYEVSVYNDTSHRQEEASR